MNVALRPLTPDDAEVTWAWRHSARARMLHLGAATVEDQRDWIADRPEGERNFVIELDGKPVGMISLLGSEVGRFLIGEPGPYGPRVAAKAQLLLFRLAFDTFGLRRLVASVPLANKGSLAWHKYTGWKRMDDRVTLELCQHDYRAVTERRLELLAGER